MVYGYSEDSKRSWQGSGFIISSNGLAVSNYHLFKNAYKVTIKYYDSTTTYNITKDDILAYSASDDFIIFKVKGKSNFSYIPVSKRISEIGDKVYTIGSPKGYENTFSNGVISQYRKGFIQITAPIDHGSSGGALINEYGEAIGITSSSIDDSKAHLNFCKDLLSLLRPYM